MKKSQMEIMGLAIIIILLSIGMLFAVKFMLKKPSVDTIKTAKESALAANVLNVLLNTNTPCAHRTIKELLQDCARTGGVIDCGTTKSCTFAKEQITTILDATFQQRNKAYQFSITGAPETQKISATNGQCTNDKEAKQHPLPVTPGFDITLKLELCEK